MKPLDSNAREVLRAGRAGEGPSSAEQERVRQKLAVALAAGVAGPAIAAPAAAAAKWWASRMVVGSLGVVSAVVVGVTAVVATRKVEAPVVVAPSVPVEPVAVLAPPVEEPIVEVPVVEVPVDTEPTTPDALQPKKPVKRVKRQVEPPAPLPPLPVVTAPAAPEKPTPDELEAETQGLREVQLALRAKEPQRALSLLDQQDRRFVQGQLKQEREAARVLALCATDSTAGSTAYQRFVGAHPGSPLLARLKAACAP